MKVSKKLIKKLIADYEDGIERISNSKYVSNSKINQFLIALNLQYGVCHLVFAKYFNTRVNYDWIHKYSTRNGFWCNIPQYESGKENKLKCLKYRLRKLKKILKEAT